MSMSPRVGLYLMSSKGFAVLRAVLDRFGAGVIEFVVFARDQATADDCSTRIPQLCDDHGVACFDRNSLPKPLPTVSLAIAVSWRWLLSPPEGQKLVVLHDSLLPRYRGFAPLVNSLVNGERSLGVSAVLASPDMEVDSGPIVAQIAHPIAYPITIAEAITQIEPVYSDIAIQVIELHDQGALTGHPQDEEAASFSPWLDELDYTIDWTRSAREVRRFVDAVGFPYRGATTVMDGKLVRILRCIESPKPLRLERPAAGKVIFVDPLGPCVACGSGAVILLDARRDDSSDPLLPLPRFRIRFESKGSA